MTTEETPQQMDMGALGMVGKEAGDLQQLEAAETGIEAALAARFRTTSSSVHVAVWHGAKDSRIWSPPPLELNHDTERMHRKVREIVLSYIKSDTLYGANGKLNRLMELELGRVGYWGQLISSEFGGNDALFREFTCLASQVAVLNPKIALLPSVDTCIGAAYPLAKKGSSTQKSQFLPGIASGERMSSFALTEPPVGSAVPDVTTRFTIRDGRVFVNGEKCFITNLRLGSDDSDAGRPLVSIVGKLDADYGEYGKEGDMRVLIAETPDDWNQNFQPIEYGLYPMKGMYNRGFRMSNFEVPLENLIQADGLKLAYGGLNLGRVMVCAGAAGILQSLLINLAPWANFRETYGDAIAKRELLMNRAADIAALQVGATAMTDWCSWLLDEGYRGELECIVAKNFGAAAQHYGLTDPFLKSHGGRSFLHGHFFGDNLFEVFAPLIYEGEGSMLWMGEFKSLVKEHGQKYFEPISKRERKTGIPLNPANPLSLWRYKDILAPYARWMIGKAISSPDISSFERLSPESRDFARLAAEALHACGLAISKLMRTRQLKLADFQLEMIEMAESVGNLVVMLATANRVGLTGDEDEREAGLILCHQLANKVFFRPPTKFNSGILKFGARLPSVESLRKRMRKLGERILAGETYWTDGYEADEIQLPYDPEILRKGKA